MLTPARRTGAEILDDPSVDRAVRERSMRDVARSNVLFGGRRAVLLALRPTVAQLRGEARARSGDERDTLMTRPSSSGDARPTAATLLDVGAGLADLPWVVRERARRRGVRLHTIALDAACSLLVSARHRVNAAVCGDALAIPFADRSVDVVVCSQLLHHFPHEAALRLLAELDRVAKRRVIVSDLRRSWIAAAGFWLASFPAGFHPITRHDGTLSVLRGFTEWELRDMVEAATGARAVVRRRLGWRLTASWAPSASISE